MSISTQKTEVLPHVQGYGYPLVSIIILNFNQTDLTRRLLASLRNITYRNVEIILVDNASREKPDQLLTEFPEILLIYNMANLGYAGGNNAGIRAARGELFLLINNDVEVPPYFMEPLVQAFKDDPECGMASPKIVYYDEGQPIQYAGSCGINMWTGRGGKRGHLEGDSGQYDFVEQTQLVHGACLMVSREVIDEVGLLAEEYFIYYEEHDWAERTKRNGFKLYFVGTSKIFHKASVTTGKKSPLKTYYMARNRILFLRRNCNYPSLIISMLVVVALSLPYHLLKLALRFDLANFRAYLLGILWHIGLRPVTTVQQGRRLHGSMK